ncbi:MAG: response regulator [Nitrososphaera sp.]|uniref:response regulator n=1 Tax=Nitrososphaera sp. TaxID=1971748 RepID=UPI003D6E960D
MSLDNQRIMVVDDESDILTVLEIFLKKWKYKVDMFSSPTRALEHFEKNAIACSVVLTDIRMPGMSGLELAGKLLKIKPGVKIILMTAFDITPAELQAGLPAVTHQDLIEKPFHLPQICREIRKRMQ